MKFYEIVFYLITDPRHWNEMHVSHWLYWCAQEFSLDNVNLDAFHMKGKDVLALGRETFVARSPPFLGDILWEHLEILQKGE